MADRMTDFQRASYWNPPLWGAGAGHWYGRPSDIGPYYGGRGYGYGSSGTFFNTNPHPGFGGANLDFANLQYASPYAGIGPRGYVRSDERIGDDINDQLTVHPGIDASDIDVQVDDGVVTLTGTVDSRATKRAARDIAYDTAGVVDVRNRLTIQSAGQQPQRERPDTRVAARRAAR